MNRTQLIKKMAAAKIEAIEISGAGRTLEVTLKNDAAANKFRKHVAAWGGRKCGWGGWILQATSAKADPYDFNSPYSHRHY
jgi:hypothetical protein